MSKANNVIQKLAYGSSYGMKKKPAKKKPMKKKAADMVGTKKTNEFGMLSVKAGIDNNPKPTKADKIIGAKMNKKASTWWGLIND